MSLAFMHTHLLIVIAVRYRTVSRRGSHMVSISPGCGRAVYRSHWGAAEGGMNSQNCFDADHGCDFGICLCSLSFWSSDWLRTSFQQPSCRHWYSFSLGCVYHPFQSVRMCAGDLLQVAALTRSAIAPMLDIFFQIRSLFSRLSETPSSGPCCLTAHMAALCFKKPVGTRTDAAGSVIVHRKAIDRIFSLEQPSFESIMKSLSQEAASDR